MKFDTRTVLWSLLRYIGAGIVIMWLTFWYLSGSFFGLPRLFVAYYAASQVFMTPMDKSTLYDGMLKGLVDSLGDPHSVYLNADEYSNIKQQTSATYAGVGMVLGIDEQGLYAVSVMEDQPAAKAGVKTGDHILTIDGQSTKDVPIDQASGLIRGEPGTVVALDVERNGEKLHFDITRESIVLPTVKSKMLTPTIGYIRVSQFAEYTADDFETQYKELQSQGMKALVLDLRDNPGGLLSTAEKLSNYIMPPGTLVTVQDRSGKLATYKSDGSETTIPLVVLVNKGSASASEIIAGAIQDRKLGTILGTNTYGKGTVQSVYPSFDNEGIKVTIAKYHTPNDRVIDGIGISPDVELDLPKGVSPSSTLEDIQIQKAVELLQ
ncbi:S41 family peptidase [Veillonella sp. AS16]|uniref:S41 family peptidase n=1 Tax=Veillonella sp. AS16 TaxID=936589 RepID=UPI0003E2C32B|nr:S41 family peptidase [Veillonella sp. AS16]ETS93604.1 peptidase, S41 family [Veillonella sp. AS16]